MRFIKIRIETKTAILYAIFGGLWILFSDSILNTLIPDHTLYMRLQTYKGWFFVSASALLIFYLIREEINRRGETEEKLRASEEFLRRFELISEHSRDIVLFMRREDGRILDVNAAAIKAYGYSRDKMLSLSVMDLRAPDTQSLTADQMAQADNGGILFETVHRRKDGSTFPVEVSSQGAMIENVRTLVSIVRDITVRKKAEEEIKSLSKFPTENPNPVLRVQNDRKLIYANAASRELLGAWGCDIGGRLPVEIDELVETAVGSASGMTVDVPCNSKVYSFMLVPIPEGEYVNLYGRDITERKQAEAALLQSEERLKRAQEIAHLGSWELDLVNNRLTWSDEVYRIFGLQPQEFAATYEAFLEAVHPDDRAAVDQAYSESIREGRDSYEIEHRIVRRSSGEIRFVHEKCEHFRNESGQIVRSAGMVHDITERVQAESQRQFLYETLNASLNEIYLFDASTLCFEFVSEGALKNLGYSLDRILQMTPLDLKPDFTPDSFEELIAPLRRHEVQAINFETRHRRSDGSLYPVDVHLQVFNQAARQVFLAIILDTTERKHREEELQRTLKELKRSNSELEQFAYVASHDLQEPLRGIAGLAQLLGQRYQGQLDSRADEYISHIVDGTQRMQTLINDLLAYSRIGRRGEAIQTTSAESALTTTLENLSAAIQDYGATITNESLPTVKADTTQLTQLFQNLIGNAIKFRSERPPHIHIGVADAGNCWQFSVSDNGIGIEPQFFERIFQVFQRLHTRREYKGTGIGLAICKKIIDRHGGQIWVESVPDVGSTFYFTLPKGD